MRLVRNFQAALAFLSRLAPSPEPYVPLADALPFFAPVGLVLGALASAASLGLCWLWGNGLVSCLAAAWLWLTALALATRAMHWDALADVADAAGSMARGERFWQIMKDSRVGAFAVLAIVAVWLGQWLCAAAHVERGGWLWLVLAPAWARGACLSLAGKASGAAASSLGQLVCAGVCRQVCGLGIAYWHRVFGVFALLALMPLAGLCLWQVVALLAAQALLHHWLGSMARREGGLSGDFLGADIELSQLLWLLLTMPACASS